MWFRFHEFITQISGMKSFMNWNFMNSYLQHSGKAPCWFTEWGKATQQWIRLACSLLETTAVYAVEILLADIADACYNGLESCSLSCDEKQTSDCKSNQPIIRNTSLSVKQTRTATPKLPNTKLWNLKLNDRALTAKAYAPKNRTMKAQVEKTNKDC